MGKDLSVIYSCSDLYAMLAGVSLFSLLENNKDIEKITVYMVLDHVSEEHKNKFFALTQEYGREIVFLDGELLAQRAQRLGLPAFIGSYASYFKLFAPEFVLPGTERLLALDSDTLVVGSLEPLLELEMGENTCIAMAKEFLSEHFDKFIKYPFGFNAGVVLYDVKNWFQGKWSEKIQDHIKNVRVCYLGLDQGLLNVVCDGHILCLPPQYNSLPTHRVFSDDVFFAKERPNYYSRETVEYAREHPVILHTYWILGQHPWNSDSIHPDTEIYNSYLQRSLWKNYQKEPSQQGPLYKLERSLYKMMPQSVFFRLFTAVQFVIHFRREKQLQKDEAKLGEDRSL